MEGNSTTLTIYNYTNFPPQKDPAPLFIDFESRLARECALMQTDGL